MSIENRSSGDLRFFLALVFYAFLIAGILWIVFFQGSWSKSKKRQRQQVVTSPFWSFGDIYIYIYIYIYIPALPNRLVLVTTGLQKPSVRVQKQPVGECWYIPYLNDQYTTYLSHHVCICCEESHSICWHALLFWWFFCSIYPLPAGMLLPVKEEAAGWLVGPSSRRSEPNIIHQTQKHQTSGTPNESS